MSLEYSRIRAICFDVDGTLRDTDDQWVIRFSDMLRPFSLLLPKRDPVVVARWLVMRLETPANLLYGIPDRLKIDHYMLRVGEWFRRVRPERRAARYLIVQGVQEMLFELHARFPIAVVSARDQRSTLAFLEHFGLTPLFHTIVTAQSCPYTKPYPDPVLYAAQQMGVNPRECLMVGDTTVDIHCGKAAGAQTVGVLCGFGEENELVGAGADLIIPSTADLLQFLLGQSG